MSVSACHGDNGDNVVVLLTPRGSGAIAVIRLCGPLNHAFAAAHFSRPPRAGRCVYCDVRDADEVLDDAVVVLAGHESLDVNIHGGPWVTEAVLQLAARFGYRTASAMTVPTMAFDAADEIERQVLTDLPAALSTPVLRLLTTQPVAWRAMLAANDRTAMRRALADTGLQRALSLPTVAIVGPPNVGKSTLANALFGEARSITADIPGTTRDWVGELADVDGLVVRLIDTPGVRQATDPIEAAAIERAGGVVERADLIVVVVDGSIPLSADAVDSIDRFRARRPETPSRVLDWEDPSWRANPWDPACPLIVRTKNDLPTCCVLAIDAIDTAAPTGDGLDALRAAIRARLGCIDLESTHARCWTSGQRELLGRRLSLPAAALTIAGPERSRPLL